jgi:hypothetical protein
MYKKTMMNDPNEYLIQINEGEAIATKDLEEFLKRGARGYSLRRRIVIT